jgi:hypothetical protein
MNRLIALAASAALLLGAAPHEAGRWLDQPHGPVYPASVPPMNQTVETRLMPQIEGLIEKLLREKRGMTLGGVKVFESNDKFLPGKIAMSMAYRVTMLKEGDPRLEQRLRDFADVAELTISDTNDSWGIYYYVAALRMLKERGLLERAVRPATLAKLRSQLDWRRFVLPDLTLIDLPNNYYGVAFSIARLRYLLGWEDERGSDQLLARTLDHYRKYSGEHGFADETEGKGRFDRYSVLLIGEIAQRLVETGMTPSAEVKAWLRRSVDVILPRFNLTGEGFEYGRSIGAYGETAFLEVLTAAARLKVLTPVEERMAYAFSSRIAARYMDFWVDPTLGSVDMWGQGRRTDAYRGKHRIFGENLSLARQHIYTNQIWNDLGYRGRAPDSGYARWLQTLPRSTTTWFARGEYDRALVTVRDRGHLIGLPIINGAEGQHMNNPYFPVPFSPGMLQGSADAGYPHLLPRITLVDGSVLMPLAFFKNVQVTRRGPETHVRWRQDALDLMGGNDARADKRATIETRYVLAPGRITRTDKLLPAPGTSVARIDFEFASFSSAPRLGKAGTVSFGKGEVRRLETNGYGVCRAGEPDDAAYKASTGPFRTLVRCTRQEPRAAGGAIELQWSLSYSSKSSA